MTLYAAYNRAFNDDGEAVVNGFGFGPYFTSMSEMTIDGLNDAEAFALGVELDFSDFWAEGLTAGYVYGQFEGSNGASPKSEFEEHDILLTYAYAEAIEMEISYTDVKDKTNPAETSEGYSLFRARINYHF